MPRPPVRRLLTLSLLGAAAAAMAGVPADNRPGAYEAPSLGVSPTVPLPAAGVRSHRISHRGVGFHVIEVDLRLARLELIGQAPGPSSVRSFAGLDGWLRGRGERIVMATNAGLFHVDHRPVGLHVEGGVEYAPVERTAGGRGNFWLLPNGVFAVADGRASITATDDWPPKRFTRRAPRIAVQSGPLLVRDGDLHPAFVEDSEHLRIRSAVGVRGGSTAVFVLSAGPVRFHDLATLFRDRLDCPDALYLDGGISGLRAPGVPLARSAAPHTYAGFLVVRAAAPPAQRVLP